MNWVKNFTPLPISCRSDIDEQTSMKHEHLRLTMCLVVCSRATIVRRTSSYASWSFTHHLVESLIVLFLFIR